MRDAVNKLSSILNDLDRYPATYDKLSASAALLQQALTKDTMVKQIIDNLTIS